MRRHAYNENKYQFDYFSKSYRQFEVDFYKYSALHVPLTFLTDDILLTMSKSGQSYFKLNKENAYDNEDHYFFFEEIASKDNDSVVIYNYHGNSHKLTEFSTQKQTS